MPNRRQFPHAPSTAPGALFRTDTTSPTDRRRFYRSVAPHVPNTTVNTAATNTTTISLVQQSGGRNSSSSRSSRNSWLSEIDIKEENIEGDNGIKMGDHNDDRNDDRDIDDDDNDDNDDDFVMANDQNDPPKKAAAAAAEEKATQTEKETETEKEKEKEREKEREKETVANNNTNTNNKPHSPVFELVTVNTASFGKSVIRCTICSNRRRACARLTADHGAVHWLTYHAKESEYEQTVDELQKLIMERLGEQ